MTTTAAILVGGKGTRLKPVIHDLPKPLAPVGGEPFLYLLLRRLKAAGIQKIVLLTGYMHDKIYTACGNGSQFDLDIVYSQELQPLGTAGALRHAAPYLEDSEDFLLLNGDTYLDSSLAQFAQTPLTDGMIGRVGAIHSQEHDRYGSLWINDKTHAILGFFEKGQQNTGIINTGVYKLNKRLLQLITVTQTSLEYDLFPSLIR